MKQHYRVRIIVEHNSIYLRCKKPPEMVGMEPTSYRFELIDREDEAAFDENWKIVHLNWFRVSAVTYTLVRGTD